MKILVIPDSFKESLTAVEACQAIEDGIREASTDISCITLPIADGGEGTTEALTAALNGELIPVSTVDALGRPLVASYGVTESGETSIIEIAAASGLELLAPSERDPLRTTTHGTGLLILDALDRGIRDFVIGLGGSATNDGGVGMLQALGARFYSPDGLIGRVEARHLSDLTSVDLSTLDARFTSASVQVACDVQNPLLGTKGATRVFGPQKGVTDTTYQRLENGLHSYADLLEKTTGKASRNNPGAGAAGGAGFALMQTTSATFRSGVDLTLDLTGADQKLEWADLVITGEGCFDSQSLDGKVPLGVAKRAQNLGKPVLIFCGVMKTASIPAELSCVQAIFPILNRLGPLPEILAEARTNLARTTTQVVRSLMLGQNLPKSSKHQGNSIHEACQ